MHLYQKIYVIYLKLIYATQYFTEILSHLADFNYGKCGEQLLKCWIFLGKIDRRDNGGGK